MTTSANTSWELNRNEFIEAALRKLSVLAEGQSASIEQLTKGAQALNSVIALFQTKGMPLWKRINQTISLIAGTNNYTIADALKVPQVVLQYIDQQTQYELIEKSEYDFNMLPAGSTSGIPVHYYFQNGIANGTLTIWPTPDTATAAQIRLLVVKQKKFDGFFNATETPDFPSYFTDALIYSLAVRLAPEYGIPILDRRELKAEEREYTEMAFSYGDEDGSIYFMPDRMFDRRG